MPKRPYPFFITTLALGFVFSLGAWYLLSEEEVGPVRIFSYGMLLGFLCSACILAVLALSKKKNIGLYVSIGAVLYVGLMLACSVLAELMFGPGGSKKIGAFSVVVTIPLILTLMSPATEKKKDA